jgi:uncharacterized protein (TIGR02186 family)
MFKSPANIILLGFLICSSSIFSQTNEEKITDLRITPSVIEVGTFFNGTQVQVTAALTERCDIVVKLVGKDESVVLNKKERKALFWLNTAKDTVKYAPSIYILAFSDALNELSGKEELEKEMLGYNSLQEKILFKSSLPLTGKEFTEFIKLKEHNGCYKIYKGAVIKLDSNGEQVLQAHLDIPSFIPVDDYDILIYCFKNGVLTDKSVINLSVEKVGLPLFISNLANESPSIYGILAIVLAMLAGVMIGMIFNKKRNG